MQVAVASELLIVGSIRRSNLVALRLGQQVLCVGRRAVILLDQSEVKNCVAHDYSVPPESAGPGASTWDSACRFWAPAQRAPFSRA